MTDDMKWRKSSRSSGGTGNCVEVGVPADRSRVAVRDTKDRDGGTLVVSPMAFAAFLRSVK
jgi:hypothetical protein